MIGHFARRIYFGLAGVMPRSSWHLIDSEVADRYVMRCGRQMQTKRDLPWEFTAIRPDLVCRQCSGGAG